MTTHRLTLNGNERFIVVTIAVNMKFRPFFDLNQIYRKTGSTEKDK